MRDGVRARSLGAAIALGVAALGAPGGADAGEVTVPIECSMGPGGQTFRATVTAPATAAHRARFLVRIDSVPSGTLSHTGLRHIADMTTDFLIGPAGRYVGGSARIVPDTGTANVRAGARVWHDATGLHLTLPARVKNGESYTPPSIELEVEAFGPPGSTVTVLFDRYRVAANVIVLGDLATTCTPKPRPSAIASVRVVDAAAP
jgi:hypothetical protein